MREFFVRPLLHAPVQAGGWVLAGPAGAGDLSAARAQMGFSLAWHVVVACLGVGMPLLTLTAEWLGVRTKDPSYRLLARRWARAMGVLFAVGAVSGTILSFELGLLWPGLMGRYGQVIGLPFAMEGFAFFIEAIFLGIEGPRVSRTGICRLIHAAIRNSSNSAWTSPGGR